MRTKWDERYGDAEYAFGTDPNDFLRDEAGRIPSGGDVLCLADGEGRNGVYLAEQGYTVCSVDLSKVGLEKANRLAVQRGVSIETVVADLAEYAVGEARWDGIVSIFFHLPSAVRASLHERVVASLKPGGVFIIEAYTPDQLVHETGGPSNKDLLMTSAALERELSGLDLAVKREVERDVIEGSFHTGRAAVVQIAGCRPVV